MVSTRTGRRDGVALRGWGWDGSPLRDGMLAGFDPLGFAAGDTNLYRYVHNDPTDFTDPDGLSGKPSRGGLAGTPPQVVPLLPNNGNGSGNWLIVFVDQPNPGTSDQYAGNPLNNPDVGHTFLGLVSPTGGLTVAGLYPANGRIDPGGGPVPGKIEDDSDHPYDVARAYPITPGQYQKLLDQINKDKKKPPNYRLQSFNCSSYAVGTAKIGGLELPVTLTNIWFGSDNGGNNTGPGPLGQDLRKYNWPGSVLIVPNGSNNGPAIAR